MNTTRGERIREFLIAEGFQVTPEGVERMRVRFAEAERRRAERHAAEAQTAEARSTEAA